MQNRLDIEPKGNSLILRFYGELTLYSLTSHQKRLEQIVSPPQKVIIDIESVRFLDTAGAIFLNELLTQYRQTNAQVELLCTHENSLKTLSLVESQKQKSQEILKQNKSSYLESLGRATIENYFGFKSFLAFLGELFFTKLGYIISIKNIRYKEISFEIYESAIRAIGIIALTSFLVGLVVAYQSAYQLKIYGANIFIVDMLGISMLRELAPLMTAIVIAGRSGSAFSAQIGAMKITQELDAMRTMGFNPYEFLVMPKIIALMIMMPILIFIADIMGVLGGIIVAHVELGISFNLFIERFEEAVAPKHFFIGILHF